MVGRSLLRQVWRRPFIATLGALLLETAPVSAAEVGPWGPIAKLRDDTATHADNKPAGGWYVAPIHVVLRARDGKLVVSGTERIAQESCNGSTQRNYGVSFVLDPAEVDGLDDGATLQVHPIDEAARDGDVRDVLYCSAQVPLADGRVLYVAGTQYPRVLPITSPELGLDYARLFDPETDTFTRIEAAMKGGPSESPGMKWYPTNRLLPDGRVLIAGGYHWSVAGPGDHENRSLEVFDPAVWDADPQADPYTVLSQPQDIPSTLNQAGRAYTHLFLLPKPVPAAHGGGVARTLALIGSVGDVWLFNHEPGLSGAERIRKAPKGTLPNPSGADKAEGSTSVMLPDGRLMIMNGGRDGPGAAIAHFYDPYQDSWDDLDLGIARIFSTATWLPDGTVLLLNGYTSEVGSPWALDNAPGGADGVRRPQLIDPFKKTVQTEDPWPEATGRGYHSIVMLLKDGRVLVGGGKDNVHDTGCEKSELRIYSPPYLAAGPRPVISNLQEGQELYVGGAPFELQVSGGVRAERGVALMAPGGMTHSYNQSQRYVPLSIVSQADGSIMVAPPATINEAPPGEYLLHVVSEQGVPSVGVYVRLKPPPACAYPVEPDAGVFIEAEGSSRRAGPFLRVDEVGRGNDAFIRVDPAATGSVEVPDEANVLWYDLDVGEAGNVYLWALGNGPSAESDTLFVSVNGGPDQVLKLAPASWGWTRVEQALALPAGKQTLKIKAAKPGAQLDRIWLTGDAAAVAPNGLGDAPPDTPCSKGQPEQPMNGGAGGAGGASMLPGGAAGQASAAGGASSGASTGPNASGGNAAVGGAAAGSGCGCRVPSSPESAARAQRWLAWWLALGAFGTLARRRSPRGARLRRGVEVR